MDDLVAALDALAVPGRASLPAAVTRVCTCSLAVAQELQEPMMSEARVQLQERLCSALLCSLDHSGIDRGAVTPPTTTTTPRDTGSRGDAHASDALAGAWRAAADVLILAYAWEEETIVMGLIGFWECVCAALRGIPPTSNLIFNNISSYAAPYSHSSSLKVPQQTTRYPNADQEAVTKGTQLFSFATWLTRTVGYEALTAVLDALGSFLAHTHVCPLRWEKPSAELLLLLLYAQLGSGDASGSVHAAGSRLTSAAAQVLHLGPWQRQLPPAAAQLTTVQVLADALSIWEAFSSTCILLQAAAAITERCSAAGKAIFQVQHYEWLALSRRAGALLHCAYGRWSNSMLQQSRDAVLPASGAQYDACMLQLLHSMLRGQPAAAAAKGAGSGTVCSSADHCGADEEEQISELQRWEACAASPGFQALAALVATHDQPALLVRGIIALELHGAAVGLQQQQQLRQQQQQQQQQPQQQQGQQQPGPSQQEQELLPPAVQLAGTQSSVQAKARAAMARTTLDRVVALLTRVYLWQGDQLVNEQAVCGPDKQASDSAQAHMRMRVSAAADAAAALLQGAAEFLRPAANCSAAEWRVAALELMGRAAEVGTALLLPDGRAADLWNQGALDGTLYSMGHDPSVRVRRAAVRLAQHIVLPSGSPGAGQLMRALARKTCDRDGGVAVLALELIGQLPWTSLAECLTPHEWCSLVQAALTALAAPPKQGSGASAHTLSAAGRQQLLQLMRGVLLRADISDHGQRSSSSLQQPLLGPDLGHVWMSRSKTEPVGLSGCRTLLLLVLRDASMAEVCEHLACSLQGSS